MITTAQIRAILVGAVALLVFAFGVFVGWRVQAVRVEAAQNDTARVEAQLLECQNVNQSYVDAIAGLKADLAAANAGCQKRLAAKAALVSKLEKIDGLKAVEVKSEKVRPAVPADDALLDALNRVYPGEADR